MIPASLTKNYVAEQFGNYMQSKFSAVIGLNYATVTPTIVDFSALGLLAISGREKSGKHNWIRYAVDMLETMYPRQSKVYVADGIGKKLATMKTRSNVCEYSMIAEDAVRYVKEMEAQLKLRYDALVAGDETVLENAELLMLIIDNQDAIQAICNDKEGLAAYKNIVGRYKNMKACILAVIENTSIPYSAPEIMKNVRDQRHVMYFDDLVNMKIFDVPLSVARNYKKQIELGDGYYYKDNECVKVKTAVMPNK